MKLSTVVMTVIASGALLVQSAGLHAWATSWLTWAVSRVPYYVNTANTDGLSDSAVLAALDTGASAWSTQSRANFSFYYAGPTNATTAQYDGKNNVFFRPDFNGGIAAYTYIWADSVTGKLLDADIVIYENDFQFFTGTSGCVNGVYLEDIATHEFGHALGLDHSLVATATMFATTSTWCFQDLRTLDPDDIAGVETLYPPTSGSVPTAPSALAVALNPSNPGSSLVLTWLDNATNEDSYRIERSADGASYAQIAQLGANAVSYADSGLASGATYFYRVSAYNGAGTSGYSNIASGQTQLTCTRANPTLTLSPSQTQWVLPGGTASYTVSLTNNDSAACGASSFVLQRNIPAGWTDALAADTLSVNPGATVSATWQVTSPAVVDPGYYQDGVKGISLVTTMSASASGMIGIGTPQMSLQVSPNGNRGSFTITASVQAGGPVSSVPVSFVVTDPNGQARQLTATTASNGQASVTLKLRASARGLYSVSATATVGGAAVTASSQFVW